jgi:hypothetical protein
MTRECQVRICEGLGVKFPGPTRHGETNSRSASVSGIHGRPGPFPISNRLPHVGSLDVALGESCHQEVPRSSKIQRQPLVSLKGGARCPTLLHARCRCRGARSSGTAAMIAAPAVAQECRLGPPEHHKGPNVFLDYDQLELDAAYDQSYYEPLDGQTYARLVSNSEAVRTRIGAPRQVAYGPTEIEKLDIFRTDHAKAPD